MPSLFSPTNMTADNLPSPYIASTAIRSGSFPPSNAFQSSTLSGYNPWLSGNGPPWYLQIDTGSGNAWIVTGYEIEASTSFPGRMPNAFVLEASNDALRWVTLDSRTGQTAWGANETRAYTPSPVSAAYRYFRTWITANDSGGGDAVCQIGQLRLFGTAGTAAAEDPDVAPHNMTADALPTPYVASASTETGGFPAWRAFDGADTVAWLGNNGGTDYLQIDLGAANTIVPSGYAIQSGGGGVNSTARCPKDFTFQASPDGSVWTVLDTETGETDWRIDWDVPETRAFVFAPGSTAYRYVKAAITANGGDATFTGFSELFVFGAAGAQQLGVSKLNLYAVTTPPVGLSVSKQVLYAVVVPGAGLAISCGGPPPATYGVPYSHAFPATGGTPPFTFAAVTYFGVPVPLSLLPWGLSLDTATGIVSGTPILVGTLFPTIQVTDSLGAVANTGFFPDGCSITINPSLVIVCGSPPAGTVGTPYSHAFPATGDIAPYTFSISAGALSDGLSLNAVTGVASGVPALAGSFSFTVGVSDTVGGTAFVPCSIAIAGAAPSPSSGDVLTARIFQGLGTAPTKMRISDHGLTAVGDRLLRLSPHRDPAHTQPQSFLLHRNGLLLTWGLDYIVSGPWIELVTAQAILPTDDFTAVISIGGEGATTFDGSITGAIDGTNGIFVLPFAPSKTMLFRNGLLLTEGLDYAQSGSIVVLSAYQTPQLTDVLTAWFWRFGGPVQATTFDDTLDYAQASLVMPFRNGLQMSVLDATADGNTVTFRSGELPLADDTVTALGWTENVSDPDMPPLNLPTRFGSDDGSIIGVLDGVNGLFTLRTSGLITQVMVFWNGDMQTEGPDYAWRCRQVDSAGAWATIIEMRNGQIPNQTDLLVAQAFMQ